MTGKQIIDLIKEKGLEDFVFSVQYRDCGGEYDGSEPVDDFFIDELNETVLI